MAASKRSRRIKVVINILCCSAVAIASFVIYWTGISVYERMLRDSRVHSKIVESNFVYGALPSPYIEHPAVHHKTSNTLDAASPPLSTLDSYAQMYEVGEYSRLYSEGQVSLLASDGVPDVQVPAFLVPSFKVPAVQPPFQVPPFQVPQVPPVPTCCVAP